MKRNRLLVFTMVLVVVLSCGAAADDETDRTNGDSGWIEIDLQIRISGRFVSSSVSMKPGDDVVRVTVPPKSIHGNPGFELIGRNIDAIDKTRRALRVLARAFFHLFKYWIRERLWIWRID